MNKFLFIAILCFFTVDSSFSKTAFFKRTEAVATVDSCKRYTEVLNVDSNIKFCYATPLERYSLDVAGCYSSKLIIYGVPVNIDSVFKLSFGYKKEIYLPAFIRADYRRVNNKISINVSFIDESMNSFRSNLHRFCIEYDVLKKKITKTAFRFLVDK